MKTLTLALSASTLTALADEIKVAVAANFTGPMEKIAPAFAQATGHKTVIAHGTTGQSYAQIQNGAPYDLSTGRAADQTLAKSFADHMSGPESRRIMTHYGFLRPGETLEP